MKNIGMKIVTVFLAVMTVIFTCYGIADSVTARRFQTYSKVTAIVVSAEPATYNITSQKKSDDSTSSNETYYLKAYQTIKVQYDYIETTYTTELKNLPILENRLYYSRSEAQYAADNLLQSLEYKMGDSIDVYTNGAKAMSAQEADKTGSLLHTFLYVIVVDIIMAVIIVIMVKIYFCKPDEEE